MIRIILLLNLMFLAPFVFTESEVENIFDTISSEWWDEDGPMKMLHSMHQTRMLFIKERILQTRMP